MSESTGPTASLNAPQLDQKQTEAQTRAFGLNLFPDSIPKIAYDTKLGGRQLHLEAVGLFTGARSAVMPIGEKSFTSQSVVGGGSLAGNYKSFHNFLFLSGGRRTA